MIPPRGGIAALLLLLVFFVLLTLAPLSPGTIRALGLSLAWWYGGVLAPLLAVIIAVGCIEPSGNRRDE